MAEAEIVDGKFACAACGKRFTWKPELAGRKGKCTCGAELMIPKAPAPKKQQAESSDDLYDLATVNDTPAPKPRPRPAASPAPAAAAGGRAPVGGGGRVPAAAGASASVLPYRGAPPPRGSDQREAEDEGSSLVEGDTLRELIIPGGLVLVGLCFHIGKQMYVADMGFSLSSLAHSLPRVALSLLFNLVLSFGAVMIVGKLFEISFGEVLPAILKLAAICLIPSAIADTAGAIVGSDSFFVAVMISSLLYIPLCYLAFWILFDIEFADAVYCVMALWVINQWVIFFIMSMLLSGGFGDGF